jgi:hypothetical protein
MHSPLLHEIIDRSAGPWHRYQERDQVTVFGHLDGLAVLDLKQSDAQQQVQHVRAVAAHRNALDHWRLMGDGVMALPRFGQGLGLQTRSIID